VRGFRSGSGELCSPTDEARLAASSLPDCLIGPSLLELALIGSARCGDARSLLVCCVTLLVMRPFIFIVLQSVAPSSIGSSRRSIILDLGLDTASW
jgi:hypothetical protein